MKLNTLANAEIGNVYSFDYKQPLSGERRRKLAKVTRKRKITDEELKKINIESDYRRADPEFERTETIITCQMPNGDYRTFYAERTENCRSSLFGRFLFWSGLGRFAFS